MLTLPPLGEPRQALERAYGGRSHQAHGVGGDGPARGAALTRGHAERQRAQRQGECAAVSQGEGLR